MRVFVDTNLWVVRLDQRDPKKRDPIGRGLQHLARDPQTPPPLPAVQIGDLLEPLSGFEVVATDAALVLDAHQLALQHQLSWFDALIAEAASRSGCDPLFSKDFNDGAQLSDLLMINPLAA